MVLEPFTKDSLPPSFNGLGHGLTLEVVRPLGGDDDSTIISEVNDYPIRWPLGVEVLPDSFLEVGHRNNDGGFES